MAILWFLLGAACTLIVIFTWSAMVVAGRADETARHLYQGGTHRIGGHDD